MDRLCWILALTFCAYCMNATSASIKENHPTRYYVKEGDTLWDIASKFLDDPWAWPELWHANTEIENPHVLYPGDILEFSYVAGEPRISVERSTPTLKFSKGDVVKLTPETRSKPVDSVIPAIPLAHVQSFLVNNRVVNREQLEDAPYLLAGGEQHIVMGIGDTVYARGTWGDEAAAAYGLYRGGKPYIDPETEEILGYEARHVGNASLVALDRTDGVATLQLTASSEAVRIGDRLLETEERRMESVFYPRSPESEVNGRIVHVFGGVRNVSQYDVVVINRGERESMAIGDVLAIYRQGEKVRDRTKNELIRLPSERSGLLIIFRTFEKVSYGLVLKAIRPLLVLDEVRNP